MSKFMKCLSIINRDGVTRYCDLLPSIARMLYRHSSEYRIDDASEYRRATVGVATLNVRSLSFQNEDVDLQNCYITDFQNMNFVPV